MKCERVRELLPAIAGGDSGLERSEAGRVKAHLDECTQCAARLFSLKQTLSLLRRVGLEEAPPAGFAASLHLRLAAEPAPTPPLSARLWRFFDRLHLGSAPRLGLAAAGLLLLIVVATLPALRSGNGGNGHGAPPEQEVAAAFRVPQQRVAVLRFDFVADVQIEDVEFEVTLPNDLHFVDGGKLLPDRRLVWRGSLSSGSNPIPLAVRGTKPGRYRVTAQAHGAGLAVRHDILLEVVRS